MTIEFFSKILVFFIFLWKRKQNCFIFSKIFTNSWFEKICVFQTLWGWHVLAVMSCPCWPVRQTVQTDLQPSCPGYPIPDFLSWLPWPGCLVSAILSQLSCYRTLVLSPPVSDVLSTLTYSCWPVRASLFQLSCLRSSVPSVLPKMFCPGCQVLNVFSLLSCSGVLSSRSSSGCTIPTVLSGCPVSVVLSQLSCPSCPAQAIMSPLAWCYHSYVLYALPCCNCTVPAVLYWLSCLLSCSSCPHCLACYPVLGVKAVLSWLLASGQGIFLN